MVRFGASVNPPFSGRPSGGTVRQELDIARYHETSFVLPQISIFKMIDALPTGIALSVCSVPRSSAFASFFQTTFLFLVDSLPQFTEKTKQKHQNKVES